MKKFGFGLMCSLIAFASVAEAANSVATVGDVSGKVLVNKGEGFVPVAGSFALQAGDKVLVGENSFATISYKECAVSLSKETVFKVTKAAPCLTGEKAAAAEGVFITPTADPYVAAAPFPWPVILLVGVGGTAIACAVACNDIFNDKDKGVSGP
jgi:hypothetical protein